MEKNLMIASAFGLGLGIGLGISMGLRYFSGSSFPTSSKPIMYNPETNDLYYNDNGIIRLVVKCKPGAKGKKGSPGKDGTDGSNGTNGADGNGINGTNGTNGSNGTNGTNGADGADGDSMFKNASASKGLALVDKGLIRNVPTGGDNYTCVFYNKVTGELAIDDASVLTNANMEAILSRI